MTEREWYLKCLFPSVLIVGIICIVFGISVLSLRWGSDIWGESPTLPEGTMIVLEDYSPPPPRGDGFTVNQDKFSMVFQVMVEDEIKEILEIAFKANGTIEVTGFQWWKSGDWTYNYDDIYANDPLIIKIDDGQFYESQK